MEWVIVLGNPEKECLVNLQIIQAIIFPEQRFHLKKQKKFNRLKTGLVFTLYINRTCFILM